MQPSLSPSAPFEAQMDITAAAEALRQARGDQNRACMLLKTYRPDLPNEQVKLYVERASVRRPPALIVIDAKDFKIAEIPEREALLVHADGTPTGSPIVTLQSINQIFAFRGLGKTMLSFAFGGSLASGQDFLCWRATRPAKVLYIEGEMPAKQLQERAKLLVPDTDPDYFRLVHLDAQSDNTIRSISTLEGRQLVEDALGDAEVLFLDSISTLANIATNPEESWLELNDWFKHLRSKYRLCLWFLHHAGKGGLQRGHSKSEDPLDLSIKLSRPKDYLITDGLRCLLEFDKTRGLSGRGFESLEIALRDGQWTWARKESELREKILKMHEENPQRSARKIAEELGCTHTIVNRYIAEAEKPKGKKQKQTKEQTLPEITGEM